MICKVKNVYIGREYDCIYITVDGKETQIAFSKEQNASNFLGETINLEMNNGKYEIKPTKEKK